MNDIRYIALQIFTQTLVEQQLINLPNNLNEKDLGFIRMLLYTALRHLPYIQKIIQKKLTRNMRIRPAAKYALILGTTELVYMSSPDYAVINSYVSLVKKISNRFTAGFVNAVLRKINLSKTTILTEDSGEFFSVDFRSLLLKHYPAKTVSAIEQACLSEPLLDITVNDKNSAICPLGKILPLGTLRLNSKGKISNLPDYQSGNWWVQDFSSSLAVKMLDNIHGKTALDLCAAPGGKTAQLISAGAQVTAVDISAYRLQTLQQNLQRLHLSPQNIICADALDYLATTSQKFDIVLLDAPCSATGTVRRHPEIAHFKTAGDVSRQSNLQRQLLEASLPKVADQGYLLYCTCSLCPEEGELQINDFISRHPDKIELVNLSNRLPEELKIISDSQGFIRVLPHLMKDYGYADGFFIALLKINIA